MFFVKVIHLEGTSVSATNHLSLKLLYTEAPVVYPQSVFWPSYYLLLSLAQINRSQNLFFRDSLLVLVNRNTPNGFIVQENRNHNTTSSLSTVTMLDVTT